MSNLKTWTGRVATHMLILVTMGIPEAGESTLTPRAPGKNKTSPRDTTKINAQSGVTSFLAWRTKQNVYGPLGMNTSRRNKAKTIDFGDYINECPLGLGGKSS